MSLPEWNLYSLNLHNLVHVLWFSPKLFLLCKRVPKMEINRQRVFYGNASNSSFFTRNNSTNLLEVHFLLLNTGTLFIFTHLPSSSSSHLPTWTTWPKDEFPSYLNASHLFLSAGHLVVASFIVNHTATD